MAQVNGCSASKPSFGTGQIYRYDPRTDEIVELPLHIPIQPKGVSLGRDYYKSETHWRTVVWDPQEKKFYGVDVAVAPWIQNLPQRSYFVPRTKT